MKVTFKLFASLSHYLPANTVANAAELEVGEDCSANRLLQDFQVPQEDVHLVLVNGVYKPADQRDTPLVAGDELAVWPPVAGG